MDTADTHIYYDISIFNNDISGAMSVNLNFNEMRSGGALINDPSSYFFSIVRFEIDTPKIPVFIPQARPNALNDLIYTFVIETVSEVNNTYVGLYKGRVQFTPVNPNLEVPDSSQNNVSNEYYYIYNFHRWIDMVNTCLANIFNAIPSSQKLLTSKAPFFAYDSSSGLVSLYTTQEYMDEQNTKRLNIYWNAPAETIFGGFDTTQISITRAHCIDADTPPIETSSHTSAYYRLNIRNPNNINRVDLGVSGTPSYYIQSKQSYPSFPLCSPIQNIVFTTSGNLPIVSSQQATPVIFSSEGDCSTQGGADNISPILTDFIVPLTNGNEYRPTINYSPSVYRLLDLKGNSPLKNCDLQVYWKSKIDAKLHPVVLGSQCGASCKIMFRKKTFDNIF